VDLIFDEIKIKIEDTIRVFSLISFETDLAKLKKRPYHLG